MKEKIRQGWEIFLYSTEKEKYYFIRDKMVQANKRNIIYVSGLSIFAMVILFISSLFVNLVAGNRLYYLGILFFSVIILLINKKWGDIRIVSFACIYIFHIALLAFGIILGTINELHEQVTVTFLIILFADPLMFLDRPVRMSLVNLASLVIYLIVAKHTQSANLYVYNLGNILPFGGLSFFVLTYAMRIKSERLVLNEENKILSEIDQITRMKNRRCYEKRLSELEVENRPGFITICALDINGLKVVNDTLGHASGDELIKGAADCIREALGKYGTCYRVGGDEFTAILTGDVPSEDELYKDIRAICSVWKGRLVRSLSISTGIVKSDGEKTISELVINADRKMYADKAEYYKRNNPEYDRTTQLLNRKSGENKVNALLSNGEQGVLMSIKVTNIKEITRNSGEKVGNKLILDIAKQLKATFREYDIIMRNTSDTFVVFTPKVEEKMFAIIWNRLEYNLKAIVMDGLQPEIMIGYESITSDKVRTFADLLDDAENNTVYI